jgi:GTP-sensing pleiotropic transcriptional regulator CodY
MGDIKLEKSKRGPPVGNQILENRIRCLEEEVTKLRVREMTIHAASQRELEAHRKVVAQMRGILDHLPWGK